MGEINWPLTNEAIIQARGLWWVRLPDEKHEESKLLPNNDYLEIIVHKTPHVKLEEAEKAVRELNEWRRKRGGRIKEERPNPKDYLNAL